MIFKGAGIDPNLVDDVEGIVEGYGSIFGNIDSDGDIIVKGAYTKTLAENGARVRYVNQHRIDQPLGKMDMLIEDEIGLKFKAKVPLTTLGKDVLLLMKSGVLNENSVGIVPIQKEYSNDGVRLLKEVKLYEISCVTLAANPMALITNAKGEIDQDLFSARFDALNRVIKKENVSDELGYAIEAELMKMKSLFIQLTTLPEDNTPTEPEVKQEDISEIFKYLKSKI
jgi:HK97 family phage prohead protease